MKTILKTNQGISLLSTGHIADLDHQIAAPVPASQGQQSEEGGHPRWGGDEAPCAGGDTGAR